MSEFPVRLSVFGIKMIKTRGYSYSPTYFKVLVYKMMVSNYFH